ncbi:MAG: filamentous hemagglutinin N-terminal domain-containing protein [Xenococcaceae cyanobacterium]
MTCRSKIVLANYSFLGWFFLCFLATTSLSQAQIVPDNTLGTESSVIRQDNVEGTPSDVIEGGAIRGENLFHSFSEFNVEAGRGAYFANPTNIDNIINRVTGSNPSNISGILGVLGNANLFFINPNGIIFGANAQLDLGGSFVASTADSIVFDNDFEFSASDPQAPPLLTVNIPLGLQFGKTPGTIINRSIEEGEGLQVQPGKTIALVGGDVLMESGIISAPGAKIELGSVADDSLVHLTFGWDLDYEGVENFQDIQLSEGAFAQTRGESGGDIQLDGRRIAIISDSGVVTENRGDNPGGSITVKASESVELDEGELTSGNLFGATGVAGDITIMTRQLNVSNGSFIDSSSGNIAQGGDLTVNATESIEIDGRGELTQASQVSTEAYSNGNAGDLKITTERLILRDGGKITSSTFGAGNAGNISVDASSIEVIGSGGLVDEQEMGTSLLAKTDGSFSATSNGNGGNISINTDRLIVQDGGTISVAAVEGSTGRAGNIEIETNSLFLNRGTITAETAQSGGEEGANINLKISELLTLENESLISATANGLANGGNIDIDANFVIAFPDRNNDIIASAARGNGGEINITTRGIFGIEERPLNPFTNDLDASSQFGLDGTIAINEIDVDPTEALEELPADVIDVTGLIEQNLCQQAKGSEFIITGKGGIAPAPSEVRDGDVSEVDLVEPVIVSENSEVEDKKDWQNAPTEVKKEIVEAQGWIVDEKGVVELVAYKTNVNGFPLQPKDTNNCHK